MSFDVMEITNTASVAPLVIELLRGSLESLPNDRAAATALIARACSVLENVGNSTRRNPAVRTGLVSWQIQKLKTHIDANMDKPLTVPVLSALVRLGPSHFQRAFKRSFGMGPHTFVMERRIHRAQTLMLTTCEPLSEIALTTGFSDQSHFTTRFHMAVGVTPGAWRRERQGMTERQPASREVRGSVNERQLVPTNA